VSRPQSSPERTASPPSLLNRILTGTNIVRNVKHSHMLLLTASDKEFVVFVHPNQTFLVPIEKVLSSRSVDLLVLHDVHRMTLSLRRAR
jgi:hypothetical protein